MRKRIGIITFHWAANHGAVLQTYASAEYLKSRNRDDEVYVIDYRPAQHRNTIRSILRPGKPAAVINRVKEYFKDKKLETFRSQHLLLTRLYASEDELISDPPGLDVFFCGSDQIWNPSFTQSGENKPTGVYYLNFAPENAIRAALSVSFGCTEYPEAARKTALPLIERFDYISVRENTGIAILRNMGIRKGQIVSDPTALLSAEQYRSLITQSANVHADIGVCILRNQSKNNRTLIGAVIRALKPGKTVNLTYASMEEWLAGIDRAKCIVTNSFHCVMIAAKFHTPFWVISEDGGRAGMNDRLITLLDYLGLSDRLVKCAGQITDHTNDIDWAAIDLKMAAYAKTLMQYFDEVLSERV